MTDLTTEETLLAYITCRKGKRKNHSTLEYEADLIRNTARTTRDLNNQTWTPGSSMCFVVTYPKIREVWAAPFADRVVHHIIYQRLRPRLEPRFLPTSFACIPGRGTLRAAQWAQRSARRATNGWSREAWALQMDIANFFPSIDQQVLLNLFQPHLTEPWLAAAVNKVVTHDVTVNAHFPGDKTLLNQVDPTKSLWHAEPGKGLPIGNLTSQFAANVYLDVADQRVIRDMRPRFYGRYVDDFLLIDPDKQKLVACRDYLIDLVADRLKLEFHPGKTRLQPVAHGIDFVGHVIKPHRTYLRRRTARKAAHVLRTTPDPDTLVPSINSYLGLARHTDSWNLRGSWCAKAKTLGMVPASDRTRIRPRRP